MAVASFVMSAIALIVSVAGVVWTIYSWHRSGARLRVKITSWRPAGEWYYKVTPTVAFDVSNAGRTATTVDAVGFKAPRSAGGRVLLPSEPSIGPNPLPGRLEPGESLMYPVPLSELLDGCEEMGVRAGDLTPYAKTGHGIFYGKWLTVALNMVRHRPAKPA